jgi:hypothetical protein
VTKAEFIAATADAPDDTEIYIDLGTGILRSRFTVDVEHLEPPPAALEIILTLETEDQFEEGDR